MIQLEHLNLVVSDIDASLAFYRAAFPHWRVRDRAQGAWSGKPRTWLHFGDDYQYLAFGDNGEGGNRDLAGHQVGLAHFAFVTNNLDALVAGSRRFPPRQARGGGASPQERLLHRSGRIRGGIRGVPERPARGA
jgi:catechol 2,3-dioxygenase-like lactoylglutathione lyase family enzyme